MTDLIGKVLNALVMAVARPVVWFIHRPVEEEDR